MNVKVIRNALIVGALMGTAALVPAKKAAAQVCSPACYACFNQYAGDYAACISAGGGEGCDIWWGSITVYCESLP
jgi:hypothetical protein